jgi:hypothetical protein
LHVLFSLYAPADDAAPDEAYDRLNKIKKQGSGCCPAFIIEKNKKPRKFPVKNEKYGLTKLGKWYTMIFIL